MLLKLHDLARLRPPPSMIAALSLIEFDPFSIKWFCADDDNQIADVCISTLAWPFNVAVTPIKMYVSKSSKWTDQISYQIITLSVCNDTMRTRCHLALKHKHRAASALWIILFLSDTVGGCKMSHLSLLINNIQSFFIIFLFIPSYLCVAYWALSPH